MYGRLINPSTGRAIRGALITFYYLRPGGSSWTPLQSVLTNASGYYSDTFNVSVTTAFATHFAGSRSFGSVWSPERWIEMPRNGTTLWNSHYSCHYTVAGGLWHGDYCAAYDRNSVGEVLRTVVNVYAFNPRSVTRIGALAFQLNTANSSWIEWRIPSNPVFRAARWAAVPRNDPTAEPEFYIYLNGGWAWWTKSQLIQYINTLEQIIQKESSTPPSSSIISADGTVPALTDLANGVDSLGGNAEIGQVMSNIYSLGVSAPLTLGDCGEAVWLCYPL